MENKIELIDYLFSMEKKKIAYSKINIDYKFNIDTLKLIEKAILNSKKIKTTYHDKLRTIEPLGVIFKEKAYVIGYEKEKGEDIYCYDLSKFKDLKLTDFDFDKNNFNLKEYAEKSFGIYGGEIYNIKLLFNQSVENKIIDKVFHPSQKIVKIRMELLQCI